MKIAHVTDAWWLLAVLSVALLLAACDSNGDEADAESAVDLSGTVMVAGQSQEPQELPGDEAMELAEERVGFPVIVPDAWPWENVTLSSMELQQSPIPRDDHSGNAVTAVYTIGDESVESVGIQQQFLPDADGSGQIAGEAETFEVDGHQIEMTDPGTGVRLFVFDAGGWSFAVNVSGEDLPEPDVMKPLLRSLIEQAEAASGEAS